MIKNTKKNKKGDTTTEKRYLRAELRQLEKNIETYISLRGTLPEYPVSGNLVFDGTHKITGISEAKADNEIVNFKQVKNAIDDDLEGKFIFKESAETEGPLSLISGKIFGVGEGIENFDAVTLSQLNHLNTVLIASSGNSSSNPISSSLNFNGNYTIKNIAAALESDDPINLKVLNEFLEGKKGLYLSLSDKKLNTNIEMNNHKIIDLADPEKDEDAVNLRTVRSLFIDYISYSGNNKNSPIEGNRILKQGRRLTGLKDPITNSDAINRRFVNESLQKRKEEFLLKTGGVFHKILDMNNQGIVNVGKGVTDGDGVILQQIIDELPFLVPLTGTKKNSVLNSSLVFNHFSTIKNFRDAKDQSEIVSRKVFNKMCSDYFNDFCIRRDRSVSEGDFDLNEKICSNLPSNSQEQEDMISVERLNVLLDEEKKLYVTVNGFSLKGNMNLNDHKIINLRDPINEKGLINIRTLKKLLLQESKKLLNKQGGVFEGALDLNNNKIVNLGEPSGDNDIVNLKFVKERLNMEFPKKKIFSGSLIFDSNHTVTGFRSPQEDNDITHLETFHEIFANVVIPGKSPLTINLVFDGIHKIKTNLSPVFDQDAVNLKSLNQILSETFIGKLPIKGGALKSDLDVDLQNIRFMNNPASETDAINLKYFNEELTKYVSIKGTLKNPVKGKFSFKEGYFIKNLMQASEESDLATMENLKKLSFFLIKNENSENRVVIGSDIVIKGSNTTTGLPEPKHEGDAINLKFLNDYLTNTFQNTPLERVNMSDHRIINLSDPVNNFDGVNLKTLKLLGNEYLSVSGTTAENPISGRLKFDNIHTVSFSSLGQRAKDAVNLKSLSEALKDNILKKSSSEIILEGDLVFNETTTITNLGKHASDYDLINLEETDKIISDYSGLFLPLTGGSINNELHMQGKRVYGMAFRNNISLAEDTEALSLQTLKNHCEKTFLKTAGVTENLISQDLSFNHTNTVSGIRNATVNTEVVNLEQTEKLFEERLSLSGTTMNKPFTSNITLNGSGILDGLKDPINDGDILTLGFVGKAFEDLKKTEACIPLSGGIIDYSLNMNGFSFLNLPKPTEFNEALRLSSMNERCSDLLLLNKIASKPISSHLTFDDRAGIKNIGDPVLPGDGVNLRSLKRILSSLTKHWILKEAPKFLSSITISKGKSKNLIAVDLTNDSSAINYGDLKTFGEQYLSLKGNDESHPFQGNMTFDNKYTITSLGDAVEDNEIINLKTTRMMIIQESSSTVSRLNPVVLGNLSLSGHRMRNISNPNTEDHVINLLSFIELTDNYKSENLMVSNNDNVITGQIDFRGHKLSDITTSSENHILNLRSLSELINEKKASKILANIDNIIQCTMDLQRHPIRNIEDPALPNDIVNKRTLIKKITDSKNELFNPQEDVLESTLDLGMNRIMGLGNAVDDGDAVNLNILRETVYSKVGFSNWAVHVFKGDISLDDNSRLIGFSDAVDDGDAVKSGQALKYIEKECTKYLSKNSPVIKADVDMGQTIISNLSNPVKIDDGLNLDAVNTYLKDYVKNDGMMIELSTDLTFNIEGRLKQIRNPENDGDAVNLKFARLYLNESSKKGISRIGDSINFLNASGHRIFNLGKPEEDSELLNLAMLNEEKELLNDFYISENVTSFDHDVDMGGYAIIDLADPQQDDDALNMGTLNKETEKYIRNTTTTTTIKKGNLSFDNGYRLRSSLVKSDYSVLSLKNLKSLLENYVKMSKVSRNENIGEILAGDIRMNNRRITNVSSSGIVDSLVPFSESIEALTQIPVLFGEDENTSVWESGNHIVWSKKAQNSPADRFFTISEDGTSLQPLFPGIYLINVSARITTGDTVTELISFEQQNLSVLSSFSCRDNHVMTLQAVISISPNSSKVFKLKNAHANSCSYTSLKWSIVRMCEVKR
ncbi:MAG: hypothetical protein RR927_04570 [Victivallaceae bacterium]